MDHFSIITVVPRLPPAIDGVGDYALNLARQLRQDFNIHTQFVVGDPTWEGPSQIQEFPVHRVNRCSSKVFISVLERLDASALLLNYVGYGYAKRGCPFWLKEGLQCWKTTLLDRILVTMFHEAYASGPPWTSAFWLSSSQKQIVTQILRQSDASVASNHIVAQILNRLQSINNYASEICPIFSSVGEPEHPLPLLSRPRRLVVFGTRSVRKRSYERGRERLQKLCRDLAIEEIYDIGTPLDLNISQLVNLPIKVMGVRTSAEISILLSQAVAGFTDYPTELLAKSSIFAAFCAHRVVPVISTRSKLCQADGLEAGTHYWKPDVQDKHLTIVNAQAIADKAFAWYQTHNLAAQAKTFNRLLRLHKQT
ncbi:MAG: glycosyltransferase family 1 protein [Anaerolineae bacterium]|nr:glycosyltransferase family 1 protein [Anaerolineae bacterium]MCB0212167.1 glycosyltransferase family 1 protein [Anaerolineae bacterium]